MATTKSQLLGTFLRMSAWECYSLLHILCKPACWRLGRSRWRRFGWPTSSLEQMTKVQSPPDQWLVKFFKECITMSSWFFSCTSMSSLNAINILGPFKYPSFSFSNSSRRVIWQSTNENDGGLWKNYNVVWIEPMTSRSRQSMLWCNQLL